MNCAFFLLNHNPILFPASFNSLNIISALVALFEKRMSSAERSCARGVQAAQSQLVSPSSYPDSITVAGSYYNILCNHPGGLMVNLKF
ncbi:hypothetical protein RB195_014156 [Necator americanus]|uniref:Uncharacterized protein n=1 Tax=Necator americanus TaxID=51031 RepID=A0ABR1DZ90_NECAM